MASDTIFLNIELNRCGRFYYISYFGGDRIADWIKFNRKYISFMCNFYTVDYTAFLPHLQLAFCKYFFQFLFGGAFKIYV